MGKTSPVGTVEALGRPVLAVGRVASTARTSRPTRPRRAPPRTSTGHARSIGIVDQGSDIVGGNIWALLWLLGGISLILALFNLLPLPPFDGGHAAVVVYEWAASKISARRVEVDYRKLMPVRRRARVLPDARSLGDVPRHPPGRRPVTSRSCRAPRATQRRVTRQIQVGAVAVGGDAPVSVQSMTTTKTADVDGTLAQIYALAAAGCDIVRCTCNEEPAAEGLAQIVPRSPVPIVADIHFQYKLALAAMEAGVQGLRLNPGNIRKPDHIKVGRARGQGPRHPDPHRGERGLARSRHRRAARRRHARGARRVGAA